jgi:hypothetical protein
LEAFFRRLDKEVVMADSEATLGENSGADEGDSSGGGATDFPKVEPAPEPDNPRYSAEHIDVENESPQPLPDAEG